MKCRSCSRRKGKRFCPAFETRICAHCCGEKRVVEIDCPPECPHLNSGQLYQARKRVLGQLRREIDPGRRERLLQTMIDHPRVIEEIETTIVRYAAGLTSLEDELILEALELVGRTYRTEQKGVIYEHASSHPLVQSLSRELQAALEVLRQPSDLESSRLGLEALLDCLEVVEDRVRYHQREGERQGSYLRFIRRDHPREAASRARSGVILTD